MENRVFLRSSGFKKHVDSPMPMRQRAGIDSSESIEYAIEMRRKDNPQTKNMYKMKRFLSDRMKPCVFL